MSPDAGLVRVGTVTRSHGLRGQVVLKALPGMEEHLSDVRQVFTQGEAERTLTLERLHRVGRSLVLGFEELSRREDSDALVGQDLWVRDTDIVLDEGEIAIEDLVGLAVRLEDGTSLGKLADVWQTGANDVYVVRSDTEEWLLPAVDAVVLGVDMEAREAVVKLLPGMEPTPLASARPAAKKAEGDER